MKTYKIPLVLFLLGMVITVIGALFKLNHLPGTSFLLIAGMLTEALAIIALIVFIMKRLK